MKEESEKERFSWLVRGLVIFIFILAIAFIVSICLSINKQYALAVSKSDIIDIPMTSALGSLVGGILSPLVSLIAVVFYYHALSLQKVGLDKQTSMQYAMNNEQEDNSKLEVIRNSAKEIDNTLSEFIYVTVPSGLCYSYRIKEALRLSNDFEVYKVTYDNSRTRNTMLESEIYIVIKYLRIIAETIPKLIVVDTSYIISFYKAKYFNLASHIYDDIHYFGYYFCENKMKEKKNDFLIDSKSIIIKFFLEQ